MKKETDNNRVYKKIIKIYESSVKSLDAITLNTIEFYCSKYKYINLELETHNEKRPPNIFKNRLKEWKKRKKNLEKEKSQLLKLIAEEMKELEKY